MTPGSGPRVIAAGTSIVDPKLGAHAIVNASNPHVGLGSGVSGAIRDACGGGVFQNEVRERWEEEFDQPLEPDDCLVTGSGRADCFRWVLHVPSVDYRRPDSETGGFTGPTRVRSCFRAALEEACQLARDHQLEGEFVLGTPLLGAGHGGLGEVVSIDVMVGALRDAWEDVAKDLAEVRFAVMTPHLTTLIQRAAEKYGLLSRFDSQS